MIGRFMFKRGGNRHAVYVRIRRGRVLQAPIIYRSWEGKTLEEIRATLPKKHRLQLWNDKDFKYK